MRIFHLSAAAIPSRTANSLQAVRMTEALTALGHDVTLFCSHGSGSDECRDPFAYYGVTRRFEIVHCRWLSIRGAGSAAYAAGVYRAMTARGLPDMFYGRHLASLVLAGYTGRPVVAEVHLPPAHVVQRLVVGRLLATPGFRKVLVISDALAAEYLRLFPGLEPGRVVVARSAADAPEHEPPPVVMAGRVAAPRVGYLGHLYPGKGIEIIAELAHAMPHVDFHVIGGTEGDIARWRRRAVRPNLLFHGHVAPGELSRWLRSLPIVLAPYLRRVGVSGGGDAARWMSPLKVFEYMAHGRAIVASDLPVIREVIEGGATGLLCPPEDVDRWKAAIQQLIDAPDLARQLGERARAEAEMRYSWSARAGLVVA